MQCTIWGQGRIGVAMATAATLAMAALALFAGMTAASARGPETVSPLAERLIDAVVNISTSQTIKGAQGVPLPKVPKGAPFEDFFDDFFKKKGPGKGGPGGDRKVSSLGSGFVIDGVEGLIVTNNHVIEGADEIYIGFNDGTKLKVERVLGRDAKTDLALLQVKSKKPLASVKFGSSQAIKVGDWVLAIGNPFGLGGSVSLGIISAKQRDLNGPYDEYLQTDAAINKGNSGGPLFDMAGDVIGVNTAIISPSGGSIGIGFAVPADTAIAVIDQLRKFGEARRGWLGVRLKSVTEETAEELGLKVNSGAQVASLVPDGPAAKAGLQAGDIIVRFDGKDIATMRGLPRYVAQTQIGRAVDVEFLRKGEKLKRQVMIGRLPDEDPAEAKKAADAKREPTGGALLGLKLAPIDDALRKRYGYDAKAQGVIVTSVDDGSPAGKKSVRAGDLIVEVAQEPVASADDVAKAIEKVRKANRKTILFRIEDTKGEPRLVSIPLS